LIFIDTSWFYAAEVEADLNHRKALESKRKLADGKLGVPYTTNYVIDETITLLRNKAGFESSLKFKEKTENSKVLKVVWILEELSHKANGIFKTHPKLKLSFTDCTSFAAMQQLGIKQALTFDDDFRVLGFRVVT